MVVSHHFAWVTTAHCILLLTSEKNRRSSLEAMPATTAAGTQMLKRKRRENEANIQGSSTHIHSQLLQIVKKVSKIVSRHKKPAVTLWLKRPRYGFLEERQWTREQAHEQEFEVNKQKGETRLSLDSSKVEHPPPKAPIRVQAEREKKKDTKRYLPSRNRGEIGCSSPYLPNRPTFAPFPGNWDGPLLSFEVNLEHQPSSKGHFVSPGLQPRRFFQEEPRRRWSLFSWLWVLLFALLRPLKIPNFTISWSLSWPSHPWPVLHYLVSMRSSRAQRLVHESSSSWQKRVHLPLLDQASSRHMAQCDPCSSLIPTHELQPARTLSPGRAPGNSPSPPSWKSCMCLSLHSGGVSHPWSQSVTDL